VYLAFSKITNIMGISTGGGTDEQKKATTQLVKTQSPP